MGCSHSKKLKSTKKVVSPSLKEVSPLPPDEPLASQVPLETTALTAKTPKFEETGKEEAKRQESTSFYWPTAYERRPNPNKMTETMEILRAAEDKKAFLLEQKMEKEKKRQLMEQHDDAEDDTLFEQPTRMPNVDFDL